MRTPAEKAALSAFIDAATSDTDPGYPRGAAYIPWQETRQTNRVLWRYLRDNRPAVLVGKKDFAMLIEPIRMGRFARLRNKLLQLITAEISYRHRDTPTAAGIPRVQADIGRRALQQRERLLAARARSPDPQ
jgi:hypothetical protein